jgi:hypothetical protein
MAQPVRTEAQDTLSERRGKRLRWGHAMATHQRAVVHSLGPIFCDLKAVGAAHTSQMSNQPVGSIKIASQKYAHMQVHQLQHPDNYVHFSNNFMLYLSKICNYLLAILIKSQLYIYYVHSSSSCCRIRNGALRVGVALMCLDGSIFSIACAIPSWS